MFTGIVTHLGKLQSKTGSTLIFHSKLAFCKKISQGTSVAINGVCLTVFKKPTHNSFSVVLMPQTQNITMLGHIEVGDLVNLELPLTLKSFLSGHIVQGHIDGVGKLKDIKKYGNSCLLKFSIPNQLSQLMVEKGSIAINGISMTLAEVGGNYFTVGVIPYTWSNTMLNTLKIGDLVNIEVDILAKYIKKFLQ